MGDTGGLKSKISARPAMASRASIVWGLVEEVF